MASVFTKILNGVIPSYKIAEDDKHYAFLDINPLAKGHTLVIPKKEVDYIFDLERDDLADLHLFSQKVARALERSIDCKRVGILVIGTEVPHAHIHLIPFQQERQMAITSERMVFTGDEMNKIAIKVNEKFESLKNEKVTLVFGASTNPERYSNKALKMLKEYKHNFVAIGGRNDNFEGTEILTGHPVLKNIDTISIYMGEEGQKEHEDYFLSLRPRRIIFNPGAENRPFAQKAQIQGIEIEEACTLVLLRTGQY